MSYAAGRPTLDADSHLMELPGFLDRFMPEDLVPRLHGRAMKRLTPVFEQATAKAARRRSDPAARAADEDRLMVDKGWSAMGSFDPAERSEVLDLLGFDGQLVLATFATFMFAGSDLDLLYAGSVAHNAAVAEFCQDDPRLLPVGYVPLTDPDRALSTLRQAIEIGCAAIHVPSTAAGERSPTHPDLFGFWQELNDSGVPFVLHIGGGGRLLDPAFHNNGMPVTDHLGGGENIRSKDFLSVPHSPQIFLGSLVLDGLFDRFPALRGGVLEEGASWVISWLHWLDHAQRAFSRTETPLAKLADRPSEYVRRHLKFTPFPGEPLDWMMEQAGPELFMFSTDYPHPEGGRDPRTKFEQAMVVAGEAERQRFYHDNMAELLGPVFARLNQPTPAG